MRSLIAVCSALLLLASFVIPASAESSSESYATGKLIELTIEPVTRGAIVYGNLAASIHNTVYMFQIQASDFIYFAQYTARAHDYKPNWIINDPINFRFEKKKMFLKRPDGKEMEVLLVKTVRVSQPEGKGTSTYSPNGSVNPDPDSSQPTELATALQEMRGKLSKWKSTVSTVDIEALEYQYKQGKQVELLKSTAAEQLDNIDRTSRFISERKKNGGFVGAPESVQLLLDMQDTESTIDHLGIMLIMMSSDEKTKSAAPSWGASLVEMSSDIMYEEKKMEVPVMKILTARDALLDVCVNKFTHQIAK
jgi:hypothetical protein